MNILILLVIVGVAGVVSLLQFTHGESDFVFEAKPIAPSPTSVISAPALSITKFEIQGEKYKEMCPSGQCKIDYGGQSFSGAPTPDSMDISFSIDFTLQDKIPNPDLGPKKKEFMEQFNLNNVCHVDDIIEENGQELYYCHGGGFGNGINRKFDSRSWEYDTIGIYDAKKNTLKVYGNYTGSR
jgi:hypothetical protein